MRLICYRKDSIGESSECYFSPNKRIVVYETMDSIGNISRRAYTNGSQVQEALQIAEGRIPNSDVRTTFTEQREVDYNDAKFEALVERCRARDIKEAEIAADFKDLKRESTRLKSSR